MLPRHWKCGGDACCLGVRSSWLGRKLRSGCRRSRQGELAGETAVSVQEPAPNRSSTESNGLDPTNILSLGVTGVLPASLAWQPAAWTGADSYTAAPITSYNLDLPQLFDTQQSKQRSARCGCQISRAGTGKKKQTFGGLVPTMQEISTRPFQLVTGRKWTGTALGPERLNRTP